MKTLFVFGNEFLESDNLAVEVAKKLDGVDVHYCRSPDDLLVADCDSFVILDVVKGAEKVVEIKDVENLKSRKLVSLHDFDVGFFLNLLAELGEEKQLRIIGLPVEGDVDELVKEVSSCI